MLTTHKSFLIVLALSFFIFAGCSKTTVTGTWKKNDFTAQPFTSIMVVGLTKDHTHKLLWEDTMGDRLRQHGIKTVVSSLSAFPDDKQIDEKEILAYANNKGIEAVLVTRLVDTKKEDVYHPPSGAYYGGAYGHYGRFDSFYPYAYNQVYSTGYTTTQTIVLLQTNLYQVKGKELIWNMSSDTFDPRSINQLMDSVSKKVLATLKKEQLI
ncbi:MAG: hypothetical protein ACI8PB_003711 [Desulforhopalus sp.]|jgi:hypothetical protein